MLGGGCFALTFTLGSAFGLAFDFQRIVDRLFRIGARSDNSIGSRGLSVGRDRRRRRREHRIVDDLAARADEALSVSRTSALNEGLQILLKVYSVYPFLAITALTTSNRQIGPP